MAAWGRQKSLFLSEDRKIYELSESINAPEYYNKLGMDLLESNAEVSNIIGKTSADHENVVFNCFVKWRNANGFGGEQCKDMIKILEECGLTNAATWLQNKQGEIPKCLSKDNVLMDLSSQIDCPTYCEKLGRKLTENEAEYSNLLGGNRPPNYKEALFQCFVRWRNREGASLESSRKLLKILRKWKLGATIQMLEEFEPALLKSAKDPNNVQCTEPMDTGELEARLHTTTQHTFDPDFHTQGAGPNYGTPKHY